LEEAAMLLACLAMCDILAFGSHAEAMALALKPAAQALLAR